MKIVILAGSPHKNGTSARLAEEFARGAEEAGHELVRFDAAYMDVHPCVGCNRCREGDKVCVFRDDMEKIRPELLSADMIVFATPVYYFMMSAQIMTVVDRFHGFNSAMAGGKKTALLVTMADGAEAADGLIRSYEEMAKYLKWEDMGKVVAENCNTPEDMEKTSFPQQAYELGKGI